MVEQNLRKMQDQFLNKKGPAGLEEQMMKLFYIIILDMLLNLKRKSRKEKDYNKILNNILVKLKINQMNFGCGKQKKEN